MTDIFISYASEDREQARKIAAALGDQGWNVWWDRTIPTGRRFSEVINEAITAARCVVVLWSRISVGKDWVLEEAEYGKERGILIPVFIEDVQPPWGFRRIQAANLYDWNGTENHSAFQKLISDIANILVPTPVAEKQRKAEEEATRKAGDEVKRRAEQEKQRRIDEERLRAKKEAEKRKAKPPTPTDSNLARKKIFARGVAAIGAIFVVVILMYVYQGFVPPAETPQQPAESGTVENASPTVKEIIVLPDPTLEPDEIIEPPVVEATPDNISAKLSKFEWQEVQKALNDIGFDAGTVDGMPGNKTFSAIVLFQESRGFPTSRDLTEAQRTRLLSDARKAAEGRLLAEQEAGTVFRDRLNDDTDGPEMVVIPAGCFEMGSPLGSGEKSERPQHRVCVPRFAMGKYEITFDEYDHFAEATGRKKPFDEKWGREKRPVIRVSWNDATAYAKWLSTETGIRYRLPSEAEWEYAARAETTTKYWWGNDGQRGHTVRANCKHCGSPWDNEQTAPVGSFGPNPFGLHDTAGNVSEWVQDCWRNSYKGAPDDGSAWLEGNDEYCSKRMFRGGSWNSLPRNLRSAYRNTYDPRGQNYVLGFRLARDL